MKKRRKLSWLPNLRERVATLPTLHRVIGLGFLLIAIAAVVAGISAWNRAQADQTTTHRLPYIVLDASVVWAGKTFQISNLGTQDWNQCKLELNAAGFGDGYSVLVEKLTPGQSVSVASQQFHRSDGTTYDLSATPPERFTIRCLNVAGVAGAYVGTVSR